MILCRIMINTSQVLTAGGFNMKSTFERQSTNHNKVACKQQRAAIRYGNPMSGGGSKEDCSKLHRKTTSPGFFFTTTKFCLKFSLSHYNVIPRCQIKKVIMFKRFGM